MHTTVYIYIITFTCFYLTKVFKNPWSLLLLVHLVRLCCQTCSRSSGMWCKKEVQAFYDNIILCMVILLIQIWIPAHNGIYQIFKVNTQFHQLWPTLNLQFYVEDSHLMMLQMRKYNVVAQKIKNKIFKSSAL